MRERLKANSNVAVYLLIPILLFVTTHAHAVFHPTVQIVKSWNGSMCQALFGSGGQSRGVLRRKNSCVRFWTGFIARATEYVLADICRGIHYRCRLGNCVARG